MQGPPPLYVNELGNEFWLDEDLTKYAMSGTKLSVYVLFMIAGNSEESFFLLIDCNDNIIFETVYSEDMQTHIDMLKAVKNMVPSVSECLAMFAQ